MKRAFNQELIKKANNNYMRFNTTVDENFIFAEGEEKDFANFIEAWTEVFKQVRSKGLTIYTAGNYQEILLKAFVNNLITLDWNNVWLNINEEIYNDDNKYIFEYIFKSISLDSFIKKLNECNNIEFVYKFYMLYGHINKIPLSDMKQTFLTYLDNAIKRENSTYEITLDEYFTQFQSFLGRNLDLLLILLEKANLDCEIEKDHILLKDKIAVSLTGPTVNDDRDTKKIISKFLSLKPGMYFTSNYKATDICQLNFLVGNNEKGKEIFYSDNYQLYSPEQYTVLKNHGYYNIEQYGKPVDYLEGIIESAERSVLLELLYSEKIKMVGVEYLSDIKYKLGEEEYNKYIEYIKSNNILTYYINEEDNEIIACHNLNSTLDYLKRARETVLISQGSRQKIKSEY